MCQLQIPGPDELGLRSRAYRTSLAPETNSNENAEKSTKPVDILSLITVWWQVRVLPAPPAGYFCFDFPRSFLLFASPADFRPFSETLLRFGIPPGTRMRASGN